MGFDFVSFFPRAVMQGIPLLFGSTGEILTEKSGNLNLGIPGIMYVGGISGVIGSFFYEQAAGGQLNGFLAIMIPILCSLLGSLLMGLLYCFLTVTLRANQNVTGLAMTTFGVGIGNFFGLLIFRLFRLLREVCRMNRCRIQYIEVQNFKLVVDQLLQTIPFLL